VAYVGLELDRPGLVARLIALGMHRPPPGRRVPWSELYLGKRAAVEALDEGAGLAARAALAAAPFYLVTGTAGYWPYDQLHGLARSLRAKHPDGPALVILDFLQLVGSPRAADGRPVVHEELRERIARAAYAARIVAVDHRLTVLLVSATPRSSYALFAGEGKADGGSVQALGTGDPARFLGTGKESGEVEYAADGVIALCRGSWPKDEPPPPTWLAVAKSRTGRAPKCTGWVCLTFDGTIFEEQEPPPPKASPSSAAPRGKAAPRSSTGRGEDDG
jgi:hypothetical protein